MLGFYDYKALEGDKRQIRRQQAEAEPVRDCAKIMELRYDLFSSAMS